MTREKFNEAAKLFEKREDLAQRIENLKSTKACAKSLGRVSSSLGWIPEAIISAGCDKYIEEAEEQLAELDQIINCL